MSRHVFAGDLIAWVFSPDTDNKPILQAGATVTAWSAKSGGSQYTDLASDVGGTSTFDHVTTDDGTGGWGYGAIPQFWGPDGVWSMWLSANGGDRLLIAAGDVGDSLGTQIVATSAQLASHISSANGHNTHLGDLVDVSAATPADGALPVYDLASGLWIAAVVPGLGSVVTLGGAQTITGPKIMGPMSDVNAIRLLLYGEATGQVANMVEFWCGTDKGQGGARQKTTYFNEKGEFRVICARFDSVGVRIKGQPGQTAHVLEQTDIANNPLSWWEPNGSWRAPNLGHTFALSVNGNISIATGAHRIYNDTGVPLTIRSVRASLGTAPTGASAIFDVNKNGSTIFSTQTNRPTIAAAANTAKAAAINDPTLNDGDYLTIDVDQIGSGTVGANLVVQVLCY